MAVEPRYSDPALSPEERAGDLLERMTLEEKLAQLGSCWSFEILERAAFDRDRARRVIGHGIGQITRIAGATNLEMREVARLANTIQRFLVEETRLGIPAIVHEECLHGLLARESVCYPQGIAQAATWDPSLVQAMGDRFGRQLRAAGAQQALAPLFDITRDPRWGRVEETYGEDAYLTAAMACAYTRGLQGEGPDGRPLPAAERIFATAKHMVGHGLAEGGRNQGPAHLGRRELADEFLFPFEAGVRDAGIRSVMNAYDDVDGVPCVASRELLTAILRGRWGFDGIVVSDYFAVEQIVTSHRLTESYALAGALALEAGIDVELPKTHAFGGPLAEALENGLVSQAAVDEAVRRVLLAKLELGLFEAPYVDVDAAAPDFTADRDLARRIAEESLVLVKNDGILPLSADVRRLAVIGPCADSARNLLGDYAHLVHIETLLQETGFGSATSVPADLKLTDELSGLPTILGAIRARVSPATEVVFAEGCGIRDGADAAMDEAVRAAASADVAVVVVGERSGLTIDSTVGESRDRVSLDLLGRQGELVRRVAETGTSVVLLLVSGRPLAPAPEIDLASAALYCWVPGEAGPAAIGRVLFGDVNPAGRMPITVPRHAGQIPLYYGHKPTGARSNWKGDYVDSSVAPLYPFGFGLSYTRFELANLRIGPSSIPVDGEVGISLDVRNEGERAGDEVVQLYVRDVEASVTRPVKQLLGFERISLAPGQMRTVTFTLAAEQLAFTGVDGRLIVEPGRIAVMVGTSSDDLPLAGAFEIAGQTAELAARSRFFSLATVD